MKTLRFASWLLALIFMLSGTAKLARLEFEVDAFARWGYPPWFMLVTGALEVAGAIGLLLPRVAALAAMCLALLMMGALATHALHAEWPMFAVATCITALAAWRGWAGRREALALLRGARSP